MLFNTYFSARFILSKKAIINLALSDRSDGKTFDCKARALLDFEQDESITIYMRRWKTEITEKVYNNFFNECWENNNDYIRFSEWEFKGSKSGVKCRKNKKEEWKQIIYFVPLSVASRIKSQITQISKIKMIDFDEYIPMDNLYLPNEITLLLDFWKTIDRDRNIVQILIAGNKIVPFCPFFDYFSIDLKIGNKDLIRTYKNNTIAVQLYSNKEHREKRQNSAFADLVEGTPYDDYEKGGVLYALDLELKSRTGADYFCQFKTARGEGTIWWNDRCLIVSEYKRKDGYIITDKSYNIVGEKYLCTFGNFPNLFKNAYRRNELFFETEKAYYIFEPILIKVGGK